MIVNGLMHMDERDRWSDVKLRSGLDQKDDP